MATRALVIAASSASSLAPADGPLLPGERRCSRRRRLGRQHVGRVGQAGRGVDRGPGHLGPHEHVGAHVLNGLEAADRLAELLALLGVGDGEVQGLGGVTHLQRGGEDGAVPEELGRGRPDPAPRRELGQLPQRRQRVERRGDALCRRARRGCPSSGSAAADTAGGEEERGVERGQVLDQPRGPTVRVRNDARPWPGPPPRRAPGPGPRPGTSRPAARGRAPAPAPRRRRRRRPGPGRCRPARAASARRRRCRPGRPSRRR